ncbi:haloacid dehalogenase-like hydrolase [Microdochium bolleyi]|uniref:Haloacid dehalogenase-like hydrolase n=1 Tax=Microdochium bolleyi TaxID=196109 RepID=A0A136IIC2_9PEZI|nr:haloacid dehalogenase-like hydrolase [Microdochium bolleyi]
MTGNKTIVFDVVGTLVSFEHLFDAIDARLGDRLKARGIQPKLLCYCWMEMAEREYTYLSLSGRYLVFYKVFEALFYRTLWYAGVEDQRAFASPDDVAYLIGEWKRMELRDGAAECIRKLRDAGFTIYCFTAGDVPRVAGYFQRAGVDMPADHVLSCDTAGLAKPTLDAYRPILARFTTDQGKPWFAAAHLWDASAAKAGGFNAAYCTALEGENLSEIFGQMDVVADTLPDMADKVIAESRK